MPYARTTDPITSHLAAKAIRRLTAKQNATWAVLAGIGPSTDKQLCSAYHEMENLDPKTFPLQYDSGIRSRRGECRDQGSVIDTGKTHKPNGRGKGEIIWKAI